MSKADTEHWQRVTRDLVKLKNTSEMMIDIAYSAVLLNSRYLAEEVQLLEEQMDQLHIDFQCRALSRTQEEVEQWRKKDPLPRLRSRLLQACRHRHHHHRRLLDGPARAASC